MAAAHANVVRDDGRRSIPAAELVPGDWNGFFQDAWPASLALLIRYVASEARRSCRRLCLGYLSAISLTAEQHGQEDAAVAALREIRRVTQSNETLRPIFEAWLSPFADLEANTVSIRDVGGIDHLSTSPSAKTSKACTLPDRHSACGRTMRRQSAGKQSPLLERRDSTTAPLSWHAWSVYDLEFLRGLDWPNHPPGKRRDARRLPTIRREVDEHGP
jgi:hypothetical protein